MVRHRTSAWRDAARQALAFSVLAGLLVLMFQVTRSNLASRGVQSGFDFLWTPAVTPVFGSPLGWRQGVDTHVLALAGGALNSLKLSAAAIAAATVVGLVIGLGRLSRHPMASALCTGYVELMRNVPVLLHVVFWYGLVLALPTVAEADPIGPLLATNRGVFLFPTIDGLAVRASVTMTPEFLALFLGISLYTAAFVAEIVRAAVGSVDRGQWEATAALGLPRATTLGRVVAPQALRVGLPPLSSEYMGIFKNSTLAVAVGYQDFMSVSETMLTDTGQSVEVMAIVMAFYAMVSLAVSVAMHAIERRNARWSLQ
jgi:general L-amino acid transport system permease protein